MFSERLDRARRAADSLVCVGLDPDLAKLPADSPAIPSLFWRSPGASSMRPWVSRPPTSRKSRSTARSARRTSSRRRSLHPRARTRGAGHPRCEAQRHRQYRRGLRARGVRSLRRRCGHGESLHGRGLGARRFWRAPTAAPSCSAAPRIRAPAISRIFWSTASLFTGASPSTRRRIGTSIAISCWSSARPTRPRWPNCGGRTRNSGSWFRESARRAAISTLRSPRASIPGGAGLLINSSRAIIYAGGGASRGDPRRGATLRDAINRRRGRNAAILQDLSLLSASRWRPRPAGRRAGLKRSQTRGGALRLRTAEGNPVLAGCLGLAQSRIGSAVNGLPVRIVGHAQRQSEAAA